MNPQWDGVVNLDDPLLSDKEGNLQPDIQSIAVADYPQLRDTYGTLSEYEAASLSRPIPSKFEDHKNVIERLFLLSLQYYSVVLLFSSLLCLYFNFFVNFYRHLLSACMTTSIPRQMEE
jgi:hypothetical protein